MKFFVVVPARIGSTRLPRKVLRDLAGRPLLRWTWQAACRSGAQRVVVATDSTEVVAACRAFGADVCMTSAAHQSGTDRAAEVARSENWDDDAIVVNLQGDEPLMPPELVQRTAALLDADHEAQIATLAHPLHRVEDWANPNFVKVVRNVKGQALYFSRARIPWRRDGVSTTPPLPGHGLAVRHMGLYAYRVGALKRFAALPPSRLEQCEALEQLRALENGFVISVGIVDHEPPRGVDTEADLALVAAQLRQAGSS
ncbi:MAG: 3-deoxy-manno-octulosonate cytidylyltransferase [Nevskiaceae bacterium]|nr:MAG: 3-deoxy-manno-octulosonate cytidylyltransferase [Nevskiaceae bacterium]TBR73321.1 MAG: 3-deoxy-manno-octulosonate cytidylyltransferase [Nevskiaceae bacterium]